MSRSPDDLYLTDEYLRHNPTWDQEDSPWKARKIGELLSLHGIQPASICEVGCGAGFVLATLRPRYPDAELFGYDIAPDASKFWPRHKAARIDFHVGDFVSANRRRYDVVLVLDVIEHVRDPFLFLSGIRESARYFVFHIPLDLSAVNVAREGPIVQQRKQVGHIHYFTKNLALSLLRESGYDIVDARYTGAGMSGPRARLKTRLAAAPRWLAQAINKDVGVRVFGGETLLVLASATIPDH